jgi:hypothetical protein
MVIIVEEEKINRISPTRIGAWIGLLVLVAVATYYVFFEQPTLIDVGATASKFPTSRDVERARQVINANDVWAHPLLQQGQYVVPPKKARFGRENPLVPL